MKKIKKTRILCATLCMALLLASISVPGVVRAEAEEDTVESGDYITNASELTEDNLPKADGMVFAGWYQDEGLTNPVRSDDDFNEGGAYIKLVHENALTVKFQLSAGATQASATTNLRLVTSVDSLKYQSVGFDITVNEKTQPAISTSVYETIYCYVNEEGTPYTPEEVFECADSKYFMAYSLNKIPRAAYGTEITVTPKWTTLNGLTVTGTTRVIKINNYASLPDKEEWYGFDTEACKTAYSNDFGSLTLDWVDEYDGAKGVMMMEIQTDGEHATTGYIGLNSEKANWPAANSLASDYSGAIGLSFRVKIERDADDDGTNQLTLFGGEGNCLGKLYTGVTVTNGWQEFFFPIDVETNYEALSEKLFFVTWTGGNQHVRIYLDEIRAVYHLENWYGFDSEACITNTILENCTANLEWLESYADANGVMKMDITANGSDAAGVFLGLQSGKQNWPSVGSEASDYHGAIGLKFRVKIERESGEGINQLTLFYNEGTQTKDLKDKNGNQVLYTGLGATDGWQEFFFPIDVEANFEQLNNMFFYFWMGGDTHSVIYFDEIQVVYE